MNVVDENFVNETTFSRMTSRGKSLNIFKPYYVALLFYAIPFLSLLIFIIDQFTVNKTDMWFWVIFLISLIPCSLIGFIISIIGIRRSTKNHSALNKVLGMIGMLLGLGGIIAGILGIMLIYLVTS
jgi:hypothetical protein